MDGFNFSLTWRMRRCSMVVLLVRRGVVVCVCLGSLSKSVLRIRNEPGLGDPPPPSHTIKLGY